MGIRDWRLRARETETGPPKSPVSSLQSLASHLQPLIALVVLGVLAGALVTWVHPVIVIAGLVGAVAGVVLLQNLQWSVWALIAVLTLLPFGAVPLGVGFNPSFLNLTFILILAAWGGGLLGRQDEGWRGSPLTLPMLLFVGVAITAFVLGTANSSLPRDVARRFVEFLLAASLVWLVPNILRSAPDVVKATRALILGGGLAAVIGVGLYLVPDALAMRLLSALRVFDYPAGPGVLRYINNDPSLPQRATGAAVDPNAFGGLLIVVAALTIPNLFSRQPIIPRRLAWVLIGLMTLALFFTRSRGSMLGLLAAAGLIALLRYRRLFVWMVVGVGLLLLLPWTQDYVASFYAGVRGQDLSTQMRLGEYKDALILIGRHPWLGVGFVSPPDIDLYIGVSSLYLLWATNTGLIGLGAFVGVMIAFFVEARRGLAEAPPALEPVILGGAAALFGVLVAGGLDHYFVNIKFPAWVTLFWLVVGLTMTATRLGTTDERG